MSTSSVPLKAKSENIFKTFRKAISRSVCEREWELNHFPHVFPDSTATCKSQTDLEMKLSCIFSAFPFLAIVLQILRVYNILFKSKTQHISADSCSRMQTYASRIKTLLKFRVRAKVVLSVILLLFIIFLYFVLFWLPSRS